MAKRKDKAAKGTRPDVSLDDLKPQQNPKGGKTPVPGGPVPIPYPNIGKTS